MAHTSVGTEHLLLGIIDEGGNLAVKVLRSLDVGLEDLRTELVASMGPGNGARAGANGLPFTPLAKRALELTTKEALGMGHNYVGCEHLLLGLLATEDGLASTVLRRMGVDLRISRRAVCAALSGFVYARQHAPAGPNAEADTVQQILHRLDALEQRLAD